MFRGANGNTANKIGTYQIAVLAKENGVPFYIAAPVSTFDLTIPDAEHIPIEERTAEEVTHIRACALRLMFTRRTWRSTLRLIATFARSSRSAVLARHPTRSR